MTRDLAHRYPDAVFVSTFWDEQEVTLRRPATNLFRFAPDYAQQEAGLGAYAYRDLGWRRAIDRRRGRQSRLGRGGRLHRRVLLARGHGRSRRSYHSTAGRPDVVARALAARPDGVATFLTLLDDPRSRSSARWRRSSTARAGSSSGARASRTRRCLARWSPAVSTAWSATTWLPSSPPSRALRDYRRRWHAAFPGLPARSAATSVVIGYHNAMEAILTALERGATRPT